MNGRHKVTIVDETVLKAGGSTEADGVSYFAHELQQGKCSVRIEALTEEHLGKWSCVLIGETGDVYEGQVEVNGNKWKFKTSGVFEAKLLISVPYF